MIKHTLRLFATALLAIAAGSVSGVTLISENRLEDTVEFRAEAMNDGRISGVIANEGTEPVNELVVLVKYNWLWKDELNPGPDSPEWVEFVTLKEQLNPGETTSFVYTPGGPLPNRDDGFFFPTAELVGMTLIK